MNTHTHTHKQVCKWVKENKLALNISKTTSIIFGPKFKLNNDASLNLSIEGLPLKQVNQTKLLGITLDSQLSWSVQIDSIVAKMGKGIAMARKCVAYTSPPILNQVVQSLILSHLDYCPVIWSSASKKELNKLQLVQNRAARLVLQCSNRTNVSLMHKRLSWLPVEHRLFVSLLYFFRKVLSSRHPTFLADQLEYIENSHTHFTRKALSGDLVLPRPRTNYLKSTVHYRAIFSWNKLPVSTRLANNKSSFKNILKSELMKKIM